MNHHRLLPLAATLALAASPAIGQTIHDWQFNETSGTNIGGSGGVGPRFVTAITGIQTNGSGALTINNNGTSNPNTFLGSGSATNIAYTSGIYDLDIKIAAWSFSVSNSASLGTASAGLYIGFMHDANAAVTADVNITTNGSQMFLQTRTYNGSALVQNSDATHSVFSATGSDLLIRLRIDADAKTSSLMFSTNDGATFTSITTDVAYAGGREANYFRFRQSADWTNANTLSLDYMTITQIPEPSSAAGLAALGALGIAVLRRRLRA